MKMRLLVDNKNMYIVISDRIYSESIPKNTVEIDKDFDWNIQNPDMKTVEQAYQEWPDLKTIINLKFVNVNTMSESEILDANIDAMNEIEHSKPSKLFTDAEIEALEMAIQDEEQNDADPLIEPMEGLVSNLKSILEKMLKLNAGL